MTHYLSNRFKSFAEKECLGSSELYTFLSYKVSNDADLLHIASLAKKGQPVPNLFFAAVHYLLLNGYDHPLKYYYFSLTDKAKPAKDAFAPFKDFCLKYKSKIIEILQHKKVQTNEVRRCAYLYPTFSYIYQTIQKPLALIEIGTSAGLQLFWDQYSYSYETTEIFGNRQSTILLSSTIKGEQFPLLLEESPPVSFRYGIDLHIIDLQNSHDRLWLQALIWPEHLERRNLLNLAINEAVNNYQSLNLMQGNGIELLSQIIKKIPDDSAICVFHTHVANQIPVEEKEHLLNQIGSIGQNRDIFHVYNNIWDSYLHLDSYMNGKETKEILAKTDGHGRWFEWLKNS